MTPPPEVYAKIFFSNATALLFQHNCSHYAAAAQRVPGACADWRRGAEPVLVSGTECASSRAVAAIPPPRASLPLTPQPPRPARSGLATCGSCLGGSGCTWCTTPTAGQDSGAGNGGSCKSGNASACTNQAAIQSSSNCAASSAGLLCAAQTTCAACVSYTGVGFYPCYWVTPASGAAFCDAGYNGFPLTTCEDIS